MNSHDFGNQRVGTTSAARARHRHEHRHGHPSISGAVLAGTDDTQALRIQLSVGFTPTFGRARTQTFHRLFVAK